MPKITLFHGCNGAHALSFLENGVLPSHTGRLGPGRYFAKDCDAAEHVSKNHHGSTSPLVLEFEVDVPGEIYDMDADPKKLGWPNFAMRNYEAATAMHPPWAGVPTPFREYCVLDKAEITLKKMHGQVVAPDTAFFIKNVGHPCFLDSWGDKVQVWGNGFHVGTDADNLKWKLKAIAGEPDTYYIVHYRFNKFLDSYGEEVWLWGDGVDIGTAPDNIKWQREPVEGIPDAYYLIHKATNKFLDSHGVPAGKELGKATLWGDGIDKGDYPANLQWQFQKA